MIDRVIPSVVVEGNTVTIRPMLYRYHGGEQLLHGLYKSSFTCDVYFLRGKHSIDSVVVLLPEENTCLLGANHGCFTFCGINGEIVFELVLSDEYDGLDEIIASNLQWASVVNEE